MLYESFFEERSMKENRKTSYAVLLFAAAWHFITYYVPRLPVFEKNYHIMETGLDRKIPLIPWTIIIYFGCYLFWIINYYLALRQEEKDFWSFFGGDFLSKLICCFFFIFLPTTLNRPEIHENGLFGFAMNFLYQVDTPDNLFPSVHCLTSWLCYICVRKNRSVPGWYKWFSMLFAIAVCISTVTTKQHVVVDIFSGILAAEFCCWISNVTGFWKLYRNVFASIFKGKEKKKP